MMDIYLYDNVFNKYVGYSNKSIDWYLASFEEKDEDKQICLLQSIKYKRKANEELNKLLSITKKL